MKEKYARVIITLPRRLLAQLDEWAEREGMTRSEALRHAIRAALKEKRRRR